MIRAQLVRSAHLAGLFLSPSGVGLKAVFRVSGVAESHLESWQAVKAHVVEIAGVAIDEACKDVCRLCFISHDPDIFINQGAIPLNCIQRTHTVSVSSVSSVYSLQQAIEIGRVRANGTTHNRLPKLIGALRAFEATTGGALGRDDLESVFVQWFSASARNLDPHETEDHYRLKFYDAWRNVKNPRTKSGLELALERAKAAPVPVEAKIFKNPDKQLFVSFCRELQIASGDKPFFLSPYSVAELFGQKNHTTAAMWFSGLCGMGILDKSAPAYFIGRIAASYRFVFADRSI